MLSCVLCKQHRCAHVLFIDLLKTHTCTVPLCAINSYHRLFCNQVQSSFTNSTQMKRQATPSNLSFFHQAVVRCRYTHPCSPCWSWVDYENTARKKEKQIQYVLPPQNNNPKQQHTHTTTKTPTQTTTVKHGVSAPEQRIALFKSNQ